MTIDGRKAGRLDQPAVGELDEFYLRELFPVLNRGQHEVRVDFRASSGRGALGHVRVMVGSDLEIEAPPTASLSEQADVNSVAALAGIVRNLMQSNERLSRMLIDSNEGHASTQISSHQELMQMMTLSLERERDAQRAAMEREEARRHHESDMDRARGDTNQRSMREMFALMATMVESRATQAGAAGPMDQFKDYMAGEMIQKGMGMFEQMMDGAGEGKSTGMAAVAEALAPAIMSKLNGTPPEPPPEPGS